MKALTTASSGTDCKDQPLLFQDLGSRKVVGDFSGGILSSDGGLLLLRQVDRGLGISVALAGCFRDERDARWVDHSVEQLLAQRLYAMALGYEDLNDHAQLRHDPLLAVACEKTDPLGQDRLLPQFRDAALACPATLNRLELSNHRSSRAHKLTHDPAQVQATLLKLGVRCLPKHAQEIVLDLDATGTLLHGEQEGRFFSAYHGGYCYQPLYVFCGNIPLWAQLRTADRGAAHGAVEAMEKILALIRKRCRHARIILRADSGFARPELMALCEAWPEVYYCFGLQRNPRLVLRVQRALAQARARQLQCGGAATRVFTEFEYATLKSWTRPRRVIAKAEVTAQGPNPRFVVTNLPAKGFAHDDELERFTPARLYEHFYCARGQMENVLKQQLLDLNADRLSTHHLGSNQLRLWLSALAYLLLERVRTLGCAGTELAVATVGSVRLKLLKVAAAVRVSVRRVYVQLSSAYPLQSLFALCHRRLMRLASASG
jgi:hypothetical protein